MYLRHGRAARTRPASAAPKRLSMSTYTEAEALIEGLALHDAEEYSEAGARYQYIMPVDSE
jgi:hypothetical protein